MIANDIEREVGRYMAMPYRIELIPDPEGWFVRMPELRGCISQGETIEEALAMIRDAQRGWIRVGLEHGDPIPEPSHDDRSPSGHFSVRVPKAVHRALIQAADAEGVSLNLYVATLLAQAVGDTVRPKRPQSAARRVRARRLACIRRS